MKSVLLTLKHKLFLLINIIGAFLMPIAALMVLIGLMIFLDTISGLIKARKRGEAITSRKLSQTVSKLVLYQVAIITFYLLEYFLLGGIVGAFTSIPILLTKIVAMFIVGVELSSINENVTAITGINYFKKFMRLLFRAKKIRKQIDEIAGDSVQEMMD